MIKVANNEVTMVGDLEELSVEITMLMATHFYQTMTKHWGEEKADLWLASMRRCASQARMPLKGVKNYEEHVIPVVNK